MCILTSLQTWVSIHTAGSWDLGTTLWVHDPARSISRSRLQTHTQSIQEWVIQQRTGTQTYSQSYIHTHIHVPVTLPIPLYRGGLALSSSCSWVLTYSVGKVIQISIPPAMPPEWEGGRERNTAVRICWLTVQNCSWMFWDLKELACMFLFQWGEKKIRWINCRVVLVLLGYAIFVLIKS